MPTDWIKQINDALYALGVYPDLEACVVQGNETLLVLEDAQAYTVYHSPEGLAQLLTTMRPWRAPTDQEVCAQVVEALRTNALPADQAARVEWQHQGYTWG